MGQKVDQGMIMKTLDWAYEKSVTLDLPGMDSAYDLAKDYNEQQGTMIDKVNSLIRWQNTKAGTSGFVTGLGGLITLPVAIPANIASVFFVQLRMIATIAIMGGYDPKQDQVRTLAFVCLCGNGAKEIIQQAGIQIGQKMALSLVKKIPGAVLIKINQAVGFRLFTKFGQTGLVNLGKAIPLVGGVIGGTIDVVSTNAIGNTARQMFIEGSLCSAENEIDEGPTAPLAITVGAVTCPSCNAENREGIKFCEECGAKMELQCPNCHVSVPLGKKFCGDCGSKLVAALGCDE